MTTENQHPKLVDMPGYATIHERLARFIEESPSPQLAAELILHAAVAIALSTHGHEALDAKLRSALGVLAAEMAKARGRLT